MTKDQMTYGLLDAMGVNSDDSNIYPSHALLFLDMARNSAIMKYLTEHGGHLPPGVLVTVTCQEIKTDCGEQYIEVPQKILDLPNDLGFYTINISGFDVPKQVSSGRAKLTEQTRWADKRYCYRVGEKIVLVGSFNKALKAKLTFVPSSTEFMDGEDQWPYPEVLAPQLWAEAVKLMTPNIKNPNDLNSDAKAETHG